MRYALLLPLTLAACVQAPTPAPAPRPLPIPPRSSPMPPPVAWQDAPLTAGSWTWARNAQGSIATFGTGQAALFSIRCDVAVRRINIVMQGTADQGAALAITTTDGARTLAAVPTAGLSQLGANLPANDGFLDRLAFSRGRFRVVLGSGRASILPTGSELARVIEDCRG